MQLRYLLATVFAFFVSQAAVAKETGLYLGASIGAATVQQSGSDPDLGDFEIDDDNFAWKIYGGYQFSGVFAIEGGYRDFGKPESNITKTDLTGLDVFGVAGLPLGPIRLFGKLGAVYWDGETSISGIKVADDDGFEFGAGAGLEFELWKLALRGEVEYFDILDDTWMYTVGATFTF
jgi:hypothetical protein